MGKKRRSSRSGKKKLRNSEKERRKKMAAKAAAAQHAAYQDHISWLNTLKNQSVRTRSATQPMPPLLRRHGAGSASQMTRIGSRRRR